VSENIKVTFPWNSTQNENQNCKNEIFAKIWSLKNSVSAIFPTKYVAVSNIFLNDHGKMQTWSVYLFLNYIYLTFYVEHYSFDATQDCRPAGHPDL